MSQSNCPINLINGKYYRRRDNTIVILGPCSCEPQWLATPDGYMYAPESSKGHMIDEFTENPEDIIDGPLDI